MDNKATSHDAVFSKQASQSVHILVVSNILTRRFNLFEVTHMTVFISVTAVVFVSWIEMASHRETAIRHISELVDVEPTLACLSKALHYADNLELMASLNLLKLKSACDVGAIDSTWL